MIMKKRVVVTGLGVVSSIGIGWKDFWKNLLAGKSGIAPIETFKPKGFDRLFAGEIKNFHPEKFLHKHKVEIMGRASQFAVVASRLAISDAKVLLKSIRERSGGICLGTTMGEPQIIELMNSTYLDRGVCGIEKRAAIRSPAHNIISCLGRELKLQNIAYLFATACSAGNYSIGYAFDLIRTGKVEIMLAGGVDAMTRLNLTGFSRLLAVAPERCQPFDKNRKGMLVGEGCGMLVLESLDSALRRKAPIYAEVLGYGLSCDAKNMTHPSIDGVALAMQTALRSSGVSPEQVDYISAHGTGTKENDRNECAAIKKIFGDRAKEIPISSIKSMLGHTMGAASALEAIACCLSISMQRVPPTINYETSDAECDIDCVPNTSRAVKLNCVINNSSAFGGNNACLVISKLQG